MALLKRKSVEPMASHLPPTTTRSRHQSLHHFVADSPWSDEQMLLCVAQWVVPAMEFSGGGWWIVDDTGLPHARHALGGRGPAVLRHAGQAGQLPGGAERDAGLPDGQPAGGLAPYLPKDWADDTARREKAGVPQAVEFATKPAIALAQIERLMEQGAPKHCVLADADYGVDTAFRERLSELGLTYVVGVTGAVTVWPPGCTPLAPPAYSGRGAVPTRQRLGPAEHQRAQSIKELAFELAPSQWQRVEWREGSNFTPRSRFARVRVGAAHRERQRTHTRAEEWLLIEWPEGHREPMKYWLSTLPEDVELQRMVFEAKMRWRIERDYQDLKQEVGLGHYEGRGWRGFHHHASLSIVAYGFLMAQQLRHPEGVGKKTLHDAKNLPYPHITNLAAAQRTQRVRPIVHHNFAAAYRRSLAHDATPMFVLPARQRKTTLLTR